MNIDAPQTIFLSLIFISLLTSANQHGKKRTNENFWSSLVRTVIALVLLIWGGFFN